MKTVILATMAAVLCFSARAVDEIDPGNQGVITALRGQVQRLEQQLNAATNRVDELEKALEQAKPYAIRGSTLPVKAERRNALKDRTIVLRLALEQKELPVQITFSNATFGAKSFDRILSPCAPWVEIGTLEGWKGLPGDTVTLFSDGYVPKVITYK